MAIGAIGIGLMVAGALLSGPFAPLFLGGAALLIVGLAAKLDQWTREGSLQSEIDATPSKSLGK